MNAPKNWTHRYTIGLILGTIGAFFTGYGVSQNMDYTAIAGAFAWAIGTGHMRYAIAIRDMQEGRIK